MSDKADVIKTVLINLMSKEEFDKQLEKGYQDIIDGNIIFAKQVFKEIREEYNLLK